MTRIYLDIAVGSQSAYDTAKEEHRAVSSWLSKNHSTYGLPSTIDELDEVGRETLESCFTGENVSTYHVVVLCSEGGYRADRAPGWSFFMQSPARCEMPPGPS